MAKGAHVQPLALCATAGHTSRRFEGFRPTHRMMSNTPVHNAGGVDVGQAPSDISCDASPTLVPQVLRPLRPV